jgi:multiple sugar transport system ATP-binding protein
VSIVENLGVTSLVTLDCGEDQIGYVVPEDDEPEIGTTVTVDAPPARVLRYDKETGLLVR